jgi:hypothetical protein
MDSRTQHYMERLARHIGDALDDARYFDRTGNSALAAARRRDARWLDRQALDLGVQAILEGR